MYEFDFLTFPFTKIDSTNIKDLIIILSTKKDGVPFFRLYFNVLSC